MTSRDSKITFRVSDDLLDRVDEIDESRSEIMREALRSYLDRGAGAGGAGGAAGARAGAGQPSGARDLRQPAGGAFGLDALLTQRIEEVVDGVVERKLAERDVNVTLNVPEYGGGASAGGEESRRHPISSTGENQGKEAVRQGGAPVETKGSSGEDKTCPQCGEGVDEDHVHCPNCGAKTAQRVFCDCGDEVRTDWSFCPSCGRRTPSSHALQG